MTNGNGHQSDECITERLPLDERYISAKKSPEREREHVREYMASQAGDEAIGHLEKVTTEVVYGRRYDVWDVHTDKARWWVITLPTNLYSQEMFPSMDMCLTFHIGLATRLLGTEEQQDDVSRLIIKAERRLQASAEALDAAREVEEFQAVGMMLREALLALVRDLANPKLVPFDVEEPKLADFIHWSEYIIDSVTATPALKRLRPPLKTAAKDAWQMVSNLTHTTSADKTLATVCANGVQHVFGQWVSLMRAASDEQAERCKSCDSLQVTKQVLVEGEAEVEQLVCEACGATARRSRGGAKGDV